MKKYLLTLLCLMILSGPIFAVQQDDMVQNEDDVFVFDDSFVFDSNDPNNVASNDMMVDIMPDFDAEADADQFVDFDNVIELS